MNRLLEEIGGMQEPQLPQQVETTAEGQYNSYEVIANAREHLDFLCALAMPTVYEYAFPPKYLALWAWMREYVHRTRDFSQLAIGLPRGFSKTTLLKLLCLYTILFTSKSYILIVCQKEEKAVDFISDVMDMLREENIRVTFGDYRQGIEIDTKSKQVFTYHGRTVVLAGIGSGGDPRGLNLKHNRPELMIMDDIQSKELAESQIQSEALLRWMVGTLMKAKSPKGCLFIFIANMYPEPYHSILRTLKRNRNWIKFIAGGILANGTSLWEELQPITQLLREFENDLEAGHPEIFYAEVMNDETASVNNIIDITKLPALPYIDGDPPLGNFIIIDPSSGKVNSDDVAIGYVEIYDTLPILQEVIHGKFSPGVTINNALQLAMEKNCRLIAIESVAYQSTLGYWFDVTAQQLGIKGITPVEVYPGMKAKNTRIMNMFKSWKAGEVFVGPKCRTQVFNEVTRFNPLKRDNTDNILDLLTYIPKVMETWPEFILAANTLLIQESQALEVIPDYENSPF